MKNSWYTFRPDEWYTFQLTNTMNIKTDLIYIYHDELVTEGKLIIDYTSGLLEEHKNQNIPDFKIKKKKKENMNKTISYKESTAIAIQAMISAARKDEYADRKRKSGFPQNRKKRDVTLKDVREWNKRRNYKEDAGIAVNAMMASAINDPYVDLNPPSKF